MQAHLTKGDLVIARTFEEWKMLFKLHCDTLDGFLPYYSGARKAVARLTQWKSVAITDESFVRAYLCKSLDVKELRSATDEFMSNRTDRAFSIFEKVHGTYSDMVATASMRESDLSMVRIRRTEYVIPRKDRSKEEKNPPRSRFPLNTKNKLPNHVYSQVKQWFDIMSNPALQKRSDLLDKYSYEHKKPEVKVVYKDKGK